MHADPSRRCHDFSPRPPDDASPLPSKIALARFPTFCRGIMFQIRPGTFGNRSSRQTKAPSRPLSADASLMKLHSLNRVMPRKGAIQPSTVIKCGLALLDAPLAADGTK